ncbi:MAG TPA: hypothetical protein VHT22_04365, partial [Casimicrobiaceae bacterium]|nr:hypothetical protein [Casimicrobiaceae bacterium]
MKPPAHRDRDILTRIITTKAEEVIGAELARPFAEVEAAARATAAPRGFERAIRQRIAAGAPAVIAEIK